MNLAKIKNLLSTFLPFFVFCAAISNFIISCCVYRRTRPQYIYSHSEVTNNVLSVVTNELRYTTELKTADDGNTSSLSNSPSLPSVHHGSYTYSVVAGKRCIRYFNHDYFEGDVCSFGMILRIFPDKVFFHNGESLVNDNIRSSDSPSIQRIKKNDR